jgi:hypothetical protein
MLYSDAQLPAAAGGGGGGAASAPAPGASPAKARARTARCTHGDNGACAHCMPVEDTDKEAWKRGDASHCQHGAGAKCPNCCPVSAAEARAAKEAPINKAAGWAVNEGKARVKAEDITGDPSWLCAHGTEFAGGVMCPHCVRREGSLPDVPPAGAWLEARRRECKCPPGGGQQCMYCVPPPEPTFKYKFCGGHAPWPRGTCNTCLAPPVFIQRQVRG